MTSATLALRQGFTLIEVLIVTVLLSFLAIATFTSVRSTLIAKETIDQKTEILQQGRAVLAMMDRDIRLAFYVTADDFIWKPSTKPLEDGTPAPPPPPKPLPITIFQGKPNEIFFSSRSHQRMAVNSPENDQHFITYQLSQGKLIRAESQRAVSLKDRESPDKFRSFTLLENIKELKLAYWDKKAERWSDSWDTEKSEWQDQLPEAVKIELTYQPDIPESPRRKIEPVTIQTAIQLIEPALKKAPQRAPALPPTPAEGAPRQ